MENYIFTATAQLIVTPSQQTDKSKIREANVRLDVSRNLNRSMYVSDQETFTKEGCKALTSTLLQGLIASIHLAHNEGLIDSADHLRMIISELERGFAEVVEIEKGTLR